MKGMHGIIFSYERCNDLGELTEVRAPASIPFGGRYRVIDFALSNMVNAGITDVGVVLHGRYQSLLDHLGTGKNWDLSRKRGGLTLLPLMLTSPSGRTTPSGASWTPLWASAPISMRSARTMWS